MATQNAISESDRGENRRRSAKPPQKFAPRRFGERSWRLYRLQQTAKLVEHVGGSPNAVQKERIDRLVELKWELRKHVVAGDLSIEQRLDFEKLLARLEREIGLQPAESASSSPASRPMTMAEFVGRR